MKIYSVSRKVLDGTFKLQVNHDIIMHTRFTEGTLISACKRNVYAKLKLFTTGLVGYLRNLNMKK